jgi:hypothetical protein
MVSWSQKFGQAVTIIIQMESATMNDWSVQLFWNDVSIGEPIPPVEFPLSVVRLVVEAGANRDFNSIHHNTQWAQAMGADEMYANNIFIQGMWERAVREYIGLAGVIRKVGPFRMRRFNTVGEVVTVSGRVTNKWEAQGDHLVEIELQSATSVGVTVGPGPVVVSLPFGEGKVSA